MAAPIVLCYVTLRLTIITFSIFLCANCLGYV